MTVVGQLATFPEMRFPAQDASLVRGPTLEFPRFLVHVGPRQPPASQTRFRFPRHAEAGGEPFGEAGAERHVDREPCFRSNWSCGEERASEPGLLDGWLLKELFFRTCFGWCKGN